MRWRLEPSPHEFQVGDLVCAKGDRERSVVEAEVADGLQIRRLSDAKLRQVRPSQLALLRSREDMGCDIGVITAETDIFRHMARVLPETGDVVMEVGSATGACTAILARSCGSENVIGIDISMQEVTRARLEHPDLRFENLDVLKEKERLRDLGQGVSILFVDIGGIRQLADLMRIMYALRAAISPKVLVIKNRELWTLVQGVMQRGCLRELNFERLEHERISSASPYEYWQFWRSCGLADLGRYLRVFSGLPPEVIDELEAAATASRNPHQAKVVLADSATSRFHGSHVLPGIHAAARAAFCGGDCAADELPSVRAAVGVRLIDLYMQLGFAKSKREAQRVVEAAGAKLNGLVVDDHRRVITEPDFVEGKLRLSLGKFEEENIYVHGVPFFF
ncbi:unnamed protein product [Prorocentrum cordatum]|uniref:Ribosomal RNA methyltransferase FtsJ domain-containing protein n=1 Tax=Prorocentrum cordatum TaxID=2364126 RepID=A0ABN9P8U4_9DINO|nr:unnamed protein product [Polarella glacialis]